MKLFKYLCLLSVCEVSEMGECTIENNTEYAQSQLITFTSIDSVCNSGNHNLMTSYYQKSVDIKWWIPKGFSSFCKNICLIFNSANPTLIYLSI